MAEFVNVHVGNQLQVSSALPGNEGSPILPQRDPLCLGIGPMAIPGTIFASGAVLVGSPLSYAAIAKPEAALMVARPNPATNPNASALSIFKVTSKVNLPPTPIDVMLGDPGIGMVGITINSLSIDIINATYINIISPETFLIGKKTHIGMNLKTGVEIRTGACNETGFKWRAGFSRDAGVRKVSSPVFAPLFVGNVTRCSGKSTGAKGFDIEHPIKKGKRVRHICVEGPESAIYIRGKLKGTHIIDIPEYWQGLVDYDTITVNLTPCGKPDLSLYVKDIRDNKIILSSDHLTQVECFYQVWADRIGPELVVEYDGESPADYPGDQSGHSIAGYNYDVRNE